MKTRRNRQQFSPGTTSQAYGLTRYSLLCYRPPSRDPITRACPNILLSSFKRKYSLSDKNIRNILESDYRLLVVAKFQHRYYVSVRSDCIEQFKHYCMYERKNHPAKKGKGRMMTSYAEMDAINKELYPFWF